MWCDYGRRCGTIALCRCFYDANGGMRWIRDFYPLDSGKFFLFVDARSSSSFSLIESAIFFDAPLSSDFFVSPRFADRAAPAACCWILDFAFIGISF